MIIAPDFDGDFAELARGLASAALAHKSLVKLAVVDRPGTDGRSHAEQLRGFASAHPPVRSRRRERRARMGGGGPAGGVAAACVDGLTGRFAVGSRRAARCRRGPRPRAVDPFGFSWLRLFRCENPDERVLDFLGFPWILSSEIETFQWVTRIFREDNFSSRFSRAVQPPEREPALEAMRKRRIAHGASLA